MNDSQKLIEAIAETVYHSPASDTRKEQPT